ncbi:hypothetical protein CR513_48693, partial [Mucuna pruriens]
MKAFEQREDELYRQIATMKAATEKLGGATMETVIVQAFRGQQFSEEIDETPILANFREVLFPDTLRRVAMHWMTTLSARSIRSFNDLAASFVSQFAANKVKQFKVVDLFDIRQAKGESPKSYLAWFNNATIRINDLDQKFLLRPFRRDSEPASLVTP